MLYFTIGLTCLYCMCHAAPQMKWPNDNDNFIDKNPQHIHFASGPTRETRIHRQKTESPSIIFFPGEQKSNCEINELSSGRNAKSDKECLAKNGEILFGGECQEMLSQGPCPDNYWVVLNTKCRPECVKRKCPLKTLFYNNACVNISAHDVCGSREILYVEFNGQVYCDCEPGLVYDSKIQRCIDEHTRGSCSFGHYIEIDIRGNLHCKYNPCKNDRLVLNPEDGSCYIKEFLGICKTGENYNNLIFRKNGKAACAVVDIRNIFEVPILNYCPNGSKKDHLNNCRKTISRRLDTNTNVYVIPVELVNSFGFCPEGYVEYPNGTCKKANALFSR